MQLITPFHGIGIIVVVATLLFHCNVNYNVNKYLQL